MGEARAEAQPGQPGELSAVSEPLSTSPRAPEEERKDACSQEVETILSNPLWVLRAHPSGPQTRASQAGQEPLGRLSRGLERPGQPGTNLPGGRAG